jgi:hypothetical protein
LRHLTNDLSNALDVHIVDDLRNFLFGPSAGLDLAAINLQRGRDLGLGTLNETRVALGLKPYTSFAQITSDATVQENLKQTYGTVDEIDLWVGVLAEDHLPGSSVGPLAQRMLVEQFTRLRDGDRMWFQNIFSGPQLQKIEATSLSDVIQRNTALTTLQSNAFIFKG